MTENSPSAFLIYMCDPLCLSINQGPSQPILEPDKHTLLFVPPKHPYKVTQDFSVGWFLSAIQQKWKVRNSKTVSMQLRGQKPKTKEPGTQTELTATILYRLVGNIAPLSNLPLK